MKYLANTELKYLTKPVEIRSCGGLLEAPGSQGEGEVDEEVDCKQDPNGEVRCQKNFSKLKLNVEMLKS